MTQATTRAEIKAIGADIAEIKDRLGRMEAWRHGNGRVGAEVRLDRLERHAGRRRRWKQAALVVGAALIGAAGGVGGRLLELMM